MGSEWRAAAALALAGVVIGSGLRAQPPQVATALASPVAIVRLTNLSTGQTIWCDDGLACISEAPPTRGETIALDTMTNMASTTGLNVAYLDPLSHVGMSQSTAAFAIGLAERNAYRAPMDAAAGFPLPTDILWNDYVCDQTIWPGGEDGPAQALGAFGFIPYFQNTEAPLAPRTHTLRVQFFGVDGRADFGGFEAEFRVEPGQIGYAGVTIDLSALDPPVAAPRAGLVMLDWIEPNNSGVGCMFTGGDLQNPIYPRPEALWTVGGHNPSSWLFADGITGAGGPPELVHPEFDGIPSSVSYLDILNTGALADWQFTAGSPPETFLPHDFACRITLAGAQACPCDLDGSGDVNSQDFFDFLAGFFAGDEDFNRSGGTDSQDFFDFLGCFFGSC
jgi:hypothetical protein